MNKKTFYTTALVTLSLLSSGFVGHAHASDQTARTPQMIEREIAELKAGLQTRVAIGKTKALQKELESLQSAGGSQPVSSPSPMITSGISQAPVSNVPTPTISPVITDGVAQTPVSSVPSTNPTPSPMITGVQPSSQPATSVVLPSATAELESLSNEYESLIKMSDGSKRPVTLTEITDFIDKLNIFQRAVLDDHPTKTLTKLEKHALSSLHQQAVMIKSRVAGDVSVEKSSNDESKRKQKVAALNIDLNEMKAFLDRGGEGGMINKRFYQLSSREKVSAEDTAKAALSKIEELLQLSNSVQQKDLMEAKKRLEKDLLALK
jgi:hypothetical protein